MATRSRAAMTVQSWQQLRRLPSANARPPVTPALIVDLEDHGPGLSRVRVVNTPDR